MRDIAGSQSFPLKLKIIKWKAEISSCRGFFGPTFLNSQITGPYQLLLTVISNNGFWISYTTLSIPKTRSLEKFAMS